jgi:hypothetical protein
MIKNKRERGRTCATRLVCVVATVLLLGAAVARDLHLAGPVGTLSSPEATGEGGEGD